VLVPLGLTLLELPGDHWLSSWFRYAMVGGCIGGTLQLLYGQLWPRVLRRTPPWPLAALGHLGSSAVAVFGGGELATRALSALYAFDPDRVRTGVWRLGLLVTLSIVGVQLVYSHLRARARRAEQSALAQRAAADRARLDALVARTNPHFLFNSLNSLAALIPDDAPAAERMVEQLAGLMRYTLEGSRRDQVPLADELAAVRDYLDIERLRSGERLRAEIDVGEELGASPIPALCLLPLVENAVLHGGPGLVRVVARRIPEGLELVVEDEGAGTGHAGTRTALADLRERLRLLHGERASLTAGPRPEGGWTARVVLP
jgi:hypothetical protein